jgi:putative methanogen marker protein 4
MSLKTIGIGVGGEAEKVLQSIAKATPGPSAILEYMMEEPPSNVKRADIAIKVCPDPADSMIADLMSGRIDAAVRGTLPANHTLSMLRRANGVSQLERAAVLETAQGKKFLLAPVGVDEGWSVQEKIELARKAQELAARLGFSRNIGILSGGRAGDIGRHVMVDRSLADAELVARMTGGIHYEILIEDAIRECGVIIAPDGISGNLIFRTLIFLGSGHGHGAPVLNISRIFIDTSRATPDYTNAIRLAEFLLK